MCALPRRLATRETATAATAAAAAVAGGMKTALASVVHIGGPYWGKSIQRVAKKDFLFFVAAAKESSQSVWGMHMGVWVCVCVYGRCVSYAEWPACERQRFVTTDVTRSHGTETGHEKFKFEFKICIENTFTICTFLLPPKNAGEHSQINLMQHWEWGRGSGASSGSWTALLAVFTFCQLV